MPVALTNSKDIVANSVSTVDYNKVVDIMGLIGEINSVISYVIGKPPLTMNTLEKISSDQQRPSVLQNDCQHD